MFERFTDRARKVMALANQEAQRFNHEYVGTEHILLAICKEGSGIASSALKNLDVDTRKIRLEVEKLIKPGADLITMGKLPQTPAAKIAVNKSIEAARNMSHNYVGTEHLLLGLIPDEGIAGQVLKAMDVTAEKLQVEYKNLVGKTEPENAAQRPQVYPVADILADEISLLERWWSKLPARGTPTTEDLDMMSIALRQIRGRAHDVALRIRQIEATESAAWAFAITTA